MTTNLSMQVTGCLVDSRDHKAGGFPFHRPANTGLRQRYARSNRLLCKPSGMNGAQHVREVDNHILHDCNHIPEYELTQALNEQVHLPSLACSHKLMNMDILIENVRNLMDAKKVTQDQFTAGVGMTQSWCSRFLSGQIKDPRRKTVERIAEFFGVTYEFLVSGEVAEVNGEVSAQAAILISRIAELDRSGRLSDALFNLISQTIDLADGVRQPAPEKTSDRLMAEDQAGNLDVVIPGREGDLLELNTTTLRRKKPA